MDAVILEAKKVFGYWSANNQIICDGRSRFDGAASFDIRPTTGWSPTTARLQPLDDRGLLR